MNIIDLRNIIPNKSNDRNRYKIEGICNHITSSSKESTISWFKNPNSQVSSHYLVAKNGDIYQFVDDYEVAWAQGIINRPTSKLYHEMKKVNPNLYLLSIEHEGVDGELTPEQYQATLELHASLVMKYNIPLDGKHILGHFELDSVFRANCPGPKFPWLNLLTDIGMIVFRDKVLDKLFQRGMIQSPDYWYTTCRLGELVKASYMSLVMIRVTGQHTIEEAIDFLTKIGIITTREYWDKNLKQGTDINGLYAKVLLEKMVKLL